MLKFIYRYFSVCVLIFILSACEYDSNATVYYDVEPMQDSINVSVTFPDYNIKDTVFISQADSIAYNLSISSGKLTSFAFVLDGDTLSSENNYVRIDSMLTTGDTYPLTLSMHVSSETGSLADIKGVEGYTMTDSTMLYVKFVAE